MSSLNERIFGSVQRKLRYSDASSTDSSVHQLGGESPTLSCILREHTAELRRQVPKRTDKEQRVARRPALSDKTNHLEKVPQNEYVAQLHSAQKAKATTATLQSGSLGSLQLPGRRDACRDHTEKEVQNTGTSRAGNELPDPSRIKSVTGRQPTPLLPQPLVSLLSARARDQDSSTDDETGRMQSRNSSPSTRSRHQSVQLDLEIAKRDALITSLQRRCAQLEMDVADDRQLEQLLDEYREKLDAAAEENRFLEEALKEERQNQQALREKIVSYKKRLAEWPAKLATEIRALESQHRHHAKEAHLLVQRLEAEKRQLQDELQRSWDAVANLRSELARSQEEATRQQVQHVRRECEQKYRRALMELETQFDVYRQEAKRALERWETRCIDMERERRELTELVAHYRSKRDELALSCSALEQQLRDQETHSAAVLQQKSATVNQLESEVEALQNRIGDLQAVIDELEMRAGAGSGGIRRSRFLPA